MSYFSAKFAISIIKLVFKSIWPFIRWAIRRCVWVIIIAVTVAVVVTASAAMVIATTVVMMTVTIIISFDGKTLVIKPMIDYLIVLILSYALTDLYRIVHKAIVTSNIAICIRRNTSTVILIPCPTCWKVFTWCLVYFILASTLIAESVV